MINLLEVCPEACFSIEAESGNEYSFVHPNKIHGAIRRHKQAEAKKRRAEHDADEQSAKAWRVERYAKQIENGAEQLDYIPRR